jgi:hypothetical protein
MIAAAVQKTSMLNSPAYGWFDFVLVAVLAFGFWRGRKNGMVKEVIPVSKWVVIVAACTFGCPLLAEVLLQNHIITTVFGTMFKESTGAFVVSYLAIALVVFVIFSFIKGAFKEKVSGSNAFGNSEYYLGMIAGTVRYACIAVFFLALINAPVYSAADIATRKEYNNRTYGGGLQGYSGDFIPTLDELQDGIFKNSLLGKAIKNNLSVLLINTGGVPKNHATAQKQAAVHPGN